METDYYTVMEKRIKYFSMKYDPHNRWGKRAPDNPEEVIKPAPKKKMGGKLKKGFEQVFSVFV